MSKLSVAMMALLGALAPAAPIPLQILSGTVTVSPGSEFVHSSVFNLVTSTGSITGTVIGFSQAVARGRTPTPYRGAPVTADASYAFGTDANLTIIHNGVSFAFTPVGLGFSPDNIRQGVIQGPQITLSPSSLVFNFPVSALFDFIEGPFNGPQNNFVFTGSGTGRLVFSSRGANSGDPNDYILTNESAVYTFSADAGVPEPATAAFAMAGLIAIAVSTVRRRGKALR